MKNFLKLVKLILFFSFFAFVSNAENIRIDGLNKLSMSDLNSITSMDVLSINYDENKINQLIKVLYDSDLIFDISYTYNNNVFNLNLIESPIIEKIFINGNIRIEDEIILSVLNSKKDFLLNKKNISNDILIIKNLYKSQGIPETSVTVSTEKYSDDRVNLIINIKESDVKKIAKLNFIGNEFFPSKYLLSIINTTPKSLYNPFSKGSNLNSDIFINDLAKLVSLYESIGYKSVKITYSLNKISGSLFELSFYIDEGYRSKINDIQYEIDDNIVNNQEFSNLINSFEKYFNKNIYFDYDQIVQFITDSNEILNSLNINDKYVDIEIIPNQDDFDLYINLKYQKPLLVNKITIYGNSITKENTLRSKLDVTPGSIYNKNKIDLENSKLSNLKYVNSSKYELKNNTNETIDLEFEIDENKKTGNILIAGTANSDTGLGASFGIKDINIFGTGNELNSSFNINSENISFDIYYKQYSFKNAKLSNTYKIYKTESDYTSSFGYKYRDTGLGYFLNYQNNKYTNSTIGFEYSNNEGYNSINSSDSSISDNIGNFSDVLFEYTISRDTTNDIFYPTSGTINSLSLNYSPEQISDNSYVKVDYSNSNYFKVDKKSSDYVFILNKLGVAEGINSNLKTKNSYSLGGLSFKGFDFRGVGPKSANNIYLGGNKYFTSTIGYGSSFLFDEKDNINLKFFYTAGSIWDSDYSSSDLKLRSSTGVSFDILTAIGPISFSYTVPINKSFDDSVRNFNFSIGTSF